MKTADELHAEALALLSCRTEYQRAIRAIEERIRAIDAEVKLLKDEAAA